MVKILIEVSADDWQAEERGHDAKLVTTHLLIECVLITEARFGLLDLLLAQQPSGFALRSLLT